MEPVLAVPKNPRRRSWRWPAIPLPGDVVEVEPTSGHNISTSVVVFLLPCVGLGAGYMLGQSLLHLGDIAALGTALLGLVLGFVPAWLINRAILRSKAPEFAVLKLLH